MKRFKLISYCLLFIGFYACYDDKGNYSYAEINEITVEGIEDFYNNVDVDDSLKIYPVITGTFYSDTSKFSYEWEVSSRIISTDFNLEIIVNMTPGTKICRFIVQDKETGIKYYYPFTLNVSSSTAGDLIMVLSKYKGNAEISYLRLDKPSNFAVNYFEERFGYNLGKNPQQLQVVYTEASACYPFTNSFGRLMVLADDQISLIDKSTLMPDTLTPYLLGEHYLQIVSYPVPDIEGYKPEYLFEAINIWRKSAYGDSYQQNNCFGQISGGTFYSTTIAPNVWSQGFYYKQKSPYTDGYLSACCFFDDMSPTPDNNLIQLGYNVGNLIVFDKYHGRFAKGSMYGSLQAIDEKYIKSFPGYDMIYGEPTSLVNNTCVAVLRNGSQYRMVMIQTGEDDDGKEVPVLVGDISLGNVVGPDSRFYTMKYNEYMFFVTDNKLYRYNMLDILSGSPPSERNVVFNLSDLNYESTASITDICVSRSERTLLLGVSRYGNDNEAMDDEVKGDLLYFDLNAASLELQYNEEKSYRGISGIPVDIQIKYQTHWRDGYYIDGTMRDNI